MDSKLTRRAVLGVVVGGLVAGPFVMRLTRRNAKGIVNDAPPLVYSDSVRKGFFEDWKAIYGQFNASFEEVRGIDSVNLRLDLSGSRNWKFRNLSTTILENVSSPLECTVSNLGPFEVAEGTISINSGILKVSLNKRERKQCLIDIGASKKNGMKISEGKGKDDGIVKSGAMTIEMDGNSQLIEKVEATPLETGAFSVIHRDGLFCPIDKNGKEIPEEEAKRSFPISIANTVFPWMMFPYPKDQVKIGELISLPKGEIFSGDWPDNVLFERVEKISGIRAARFMSDQTYSAEQLRDYYLAQRVFLQERGIEGPNHLKQQIEGTEKHKIEKRKMLRTHVDLNTGLSVGRESLESATGMGITPTSLSSIFQIS